MSKLRELKADTDFFAEALGCMKDPESQVVLEVVPREAAQFYNEARVLVSIEGRCYQATISMERIT